MALANDSIVVAPGSGATRICTKCFIERRLEDFYSDRSSKSRKDKKASWCRICVLAKNKEWQAKHKEERRAYERSRHHHRKMARDGLRFAVLKAYGGVCACCGEGNLVFLAIDHIHGNGKKQRKALSNHTYRWLKNNDYPPGYQVLCHNCNWAKYRGGCPHQLGAV